MSVVIGLDIGTGGARALAIDSQGHIVARSKSPFAAPPYQPQPGWAEQNALEWWEASKTCLREIITALGTITVEAIAIDATSGTFVPISRDGTPLIPALMYNDGRAAGLEGEVNAAAAEFCIQHGYTFPPAFALVKMLWLQRHLPDVIAQTYKFSHSADFVVGRLSGNYDCTDSSNALKSGVNLITGTWPDFIASKLGLPESLFPQVYRPGQQIATVSAEAAAETGLRAGTPIIAGASDGMASFLASGACEPGDWNLTIGTTIAIRGVSPDVVRDPEGRIYCHRHPEGYWLPGGASNVGGESLLKVFGQAQITDLDTQAESSIPTSLIVYPLVRRGERMPFVSATIEGFTIGTPRSEAERFAAYLEGIALTTAWSVETSQALGAPADGKFFLSGGGAHGKTLGKVIASALNRNLHVAEEPDAAMGSALLAAGWAWHQGSVSAAQKALVQTSSVISPVPAWVPPLRQKLSELQVACLQHRSP
jgi:xylulokinase